MRERECVCKGVGMGKKVSSCMISHLRFLPSALRARVLRPLRSPLSCNRLAITVWSLRG